ncbi:MAG: hypothetical protein K2Y23_24475 [Cyanobacteria bacterium]|nr:hypothetical protein [Cyanobacteriota bacterium]
MRIAILAIAIAVIAGGPADTQSVRNAGKYGAMFSWWYDALPPQTIDTPTIEWNARSMAWWNGVVRQAVYARLGWIAAASWGEETTADPAMLEPLLRRSMRTAAA